MLKQYAILSNCIHELKKSHLPMLEKLKLELQLIQTKRLLLQDDIGAKVSGVSSSENEFRELHDLICRAGGFDYGRGETSAIGGRLTRLMNELRGADPDDAPCAPVVSSYLSH